MKNPCRKPRLTLVFHLPPWTPSSDVSTAGTTAWNAHQLPPFLDHIGGTASSLMAPGELQAQRPVLGKGSAQAMVQIEFRRGPSRPQPPLGILQGESSKLQRRGRKRTGSWGGLSRKLPGSHQAQTQTPPPGGARAGKATSASAGRRGHASGQGGRSTGEPGAGRGGSGARASSRQAPVWGRTTRPANGTATGRAQEQGTATTGTKADPGGQGSGWGRRQACAAQGPAGASGSGGQAGAGPEGPRAPAPAVGAGRGRGPSPEPPRRTERQCRRQ